MYLSKSLFATWLCLAQVQYGSALAFTKWPTSLETEKPVTVTWDGSPDIPTTIKLRKGTATDLNDVTVLTTQATGGSFTWTPPASLEAGSDYAFQVSQASGDINYSALIPLANNSKPAPAASPSPSPSPSPAVIPPSKGPRPVSQDPDSPDFDTAPRDDDLDVDDEVEEGNNGETMTLDEAPSSDSNSTSGKSAVAAQMQTGGADYRTTSLEFVLGAAAMIFYLSR